MFSDNVSIKPTPPKPEETLKKVAIESLLKTPFTHDELLAVWNTYKATLLKNGKFNLASIFEAIPQLEGNIILMLIENKALEDEFLLQKVDFLDFFRKELNNYAIDFTTTINKDTATKKAYTPEEKYAKMVEKNPALAKLKQKLNLEVGY